MKITYTVKRGKNVGLVPIPHRYEDGMFLAHKTNSRNDPEGRRVRSEAELWDLVQQGYHVRMSNMPARPLAVHRQAGLAADGYPRALSIASRTTPLSRNTTAGYWFSLTESR